MDRDRRARDDGVRAALARMAARHASVSAGQPQADRTGAAVELPRPIEASWRRSLAAGLDPGVFAITSREAPSYAADLVRLATPVIDRLAESLDGTGVCVILGDANANVLQRRTEDSGLLARLDRISLAPGFGYAERSVGTNAIGTALAQRSPSFVLGGQHFADQLTNMACAAAPLIDRASGQVIGFLDVTSRVGKGHPLMLALVRQAATEVERVLDAAGFRWSGIKAELGRSTLVAEVPATPRLTPTERAVADLVALGLTNQAVARRLAISPHTVDTHLRHIYGKLSVRSRVELARMVMTTAAI